jgi:glutamate-1-semialdehyde aminotransferase
MVLPHEPAVFFRLAALAREHGAVFILDEVKTALRIAPGSIAQRVGLVPDLITVSKALGNGFPVAALLGRAEVMAAGADMHYSGTFHGDTAAMAAARKTLELADRHRAADHAHELGERLIAGLNEIARDAGVVARAYGEPLPPMPFFRFTHEQPELNERLTATFYREVLARGVLLHPRHMWFISLAHTARDIEQTLDVAEAAMRIAARELP